jgi:hypothetical protein
MSAEIKRFIWNFHALYFEIILKEDSQKCRKNITKLIHKTNFVLEFRRSVNGSTSAS